MTNKEAIEILSAYYEMDDDRQNVALDMAISALQAQEVKQEVKQEAKKSGCTYKPDCPWYDGSKCNSPNDHGYHECDYDRGIFPESYEELSNNSPKLDKENGDLQPTCNLLATDTISRQAAISELMEWVEKEEKKSWSTFKGLFHWTGVKAMLECLPSAQPEIVRCKDCKHVFRYRSEESAKKFGQIYECRRGVLNLPKLNDFCSKAERRNDEGKT